MFLFQFSCELLQRYVFWFLYACVEQERYEYESRYVCAELEQYVSLFRNGSSFEQSCEYEFEERLQLHCTCKSVGLDGSL